MLENTEKFSGASENKQKRNICLLLTALLVVFISSCICIFFMIGSDIFFPDVKHEYLTFSMSNDIGMAVEMISQHAADRIDELPTVYAVPMEQYISPKPKKENYGKNYSSYTDETITANYYSERHYNSKFHFIEVTIAHPSQLRMALAGNEYGEKKMYPQSIAAEVNAVAAVNGSYYNIRSNGILYYQGKLCRSKAIGWQVLLIDSEGDLHVVMDKEIANGNIDGEYEIVNSVTFGPALVLDGKVQPTQTAYGFPDTLEPRAAIAQLGKLHYLLCTVDSRQTDSSGVTQQQLAKVLAEKGCILAYNLDGGQSATLLMGGQVKNRVAYGGQRVLGDILYFCTALPDDVEN